MVGSPLDSALPSLALLLGLEVVASAADITAKELEIEKAKLQQSQDVQTKRFLLWQVDQGEVADRLFYGGSQMVAAITNGAACNVR